MSYIDIIAIIIFIVFMPMKFISDYHRLFKPWKEQKINRVKEWNRQRNNRTRELKKQIKEWNRRRNNRTRELKKQIKEWGRKKFRNCKAWRKKNISPKWKKATPFKKIYIFFSCIIGVILFILFLALCSQIILLPFDASKIKKIDSNFALAFLGTVSGGVALFTGYIAILRSETNTRQNEIANDQNEITEQGLITDRINKAVESLGKVNQKGESILEVRIGALFALERIAQDSLRDHIRIMKIICAYIYVRKPLSNSRSEAHPVTEDVRAALFIIGQRGKWTEDQEHLKEETNKKYRLDLRHCNLNNASLDYTNLSKAELINTTLETTALNEAILRDTNLNGTNLTEAELTRTDFKNADMAKAFAYEGDFSRCLNLSQYQLEQMYCGSEIKVKIPNNLTRPLHWSEDDLTREEFIEAYEEWEKNQE